MTLHSRILLLFLSFLSLSVYAQRKEQLGGLERMPEAKSGFHTIEAKSQQALNLPFTDDFSYDGNTVDPSKWEMSDVWVNKTWARSPITLGVASFDGLNRYGRPYTYVGNDSVGDILSSREIDLSAVTDSVYLSFYYQAGGWGEKPGIGDDSLVLEFWHGGDSLWRSIWRNADYPDTAWRLVMQAVDTDFHRDDFRFRFRSFGSKQGALDVWHIDYVDLDDQRSIGDSIPRDIAFTVPHPSLLVKYESIPWWHVNESFNIQGVFKPELDLKYRRNVLDNSTNINLNLGIYQVRYNGGLLQQQNTIGPGLASSHPNNEEVTYTIPPLGEPRLNFINPPYPDEFEINSFHTFSGSNNDIPRNDTIYHTQVFKNYYAYDDGSAERAYEVLNNRGGFIVQRYDILVDDTLKGLQLYFQPAIYDLEDQEFTILIISNQSGIPGTVLYETDSVYTAQYTDGNFYQTYLLDTTIAGPRTNGTVFIGIRQQNNDPVSLGYDQNSRNRTTAFYGEVDDMYQSGLNGTIMMRPVFKYIPRDFSLVDRLKSNNFNVYPNPSEGSLHFDLPLELRELEGYKLYLYNLQGQVLAKHEVSEFWQLPESPAGLYLIRLQSEQNAQSWQSKIQIR